MSQKSNQLNEHKKNRFAYRNNSQSDIRNSEQMSDLIERKQFDQVSANSIKSAISDMNFVSPIPLPKNAKKIPSNEEIGDTFEKIEQEFPQVQVDTLFSMLYNNVISPKIKQEDLSEMSYHKSKSDYRSNYSNLSQVTMIKPGQLPFKVHSMKQNNDNINRKKETTKTKKCKQLKGETKQLKKQQSNHKRGQNQQNIRKVQEWNSQENKEYQLFAKSVSKAFNSKQDEIKFQQKKLIAKAYCERGYGIDKLKQIVWQEQHKVYQIEKKRYKAICMVCVAEGYRKLQQFLIDDCKRNIKPLTSPEVRALQPLLLNAQAKLEDQEYLVFRKFMKVTFDLGSVSIFEQLAVKLYIKLQICLRGRVGAMKLDRPFGSDYRPRRDMLKSPGRFLHQRLESQTIWTSELEIELLDFVILHKTIAKTRDALKNKYGEHVVLNNVRELKARFFKILRLAAKRLNRYSSDFAHEVPLLVNLGDEKIKTIIRHPAALNARIALAKLYKTKKVDSQLLTEIINTVNQFCYLEETRREKHEKQRQPIINTITDKIKHNINVSKKLLKHVTTAAQRAGAESNLIFLKESEKNYQHIVSLEHNDKLHYFRKTGILNNKGGFQYVQKPPQLKKLQLDDGDDDSQQLVLLSDDDYQSSYQASDL